MKYGRSQSKYKSKAFRGNPGSSACPKDAQTAFWILSMDELADDALDSWVELYDGTRNLKICQHLGKR